MHHINKLQELNYLYSPDSVWATKTFTMTITTDFDIGDEVKLNNGEKGTITGINIRVREGKRGGDYKIEYEVDHSYIRLSFQLTRV